jgi:hypothetical protein
VNIREEEFLMGGFAPIKFDDEAYQMWIWSFIRFAGLYDQRLVFGFDRLGRFPVVEGFESSFPTPFLPHPLRPKGGFKDLPPKANS